MFLPGSAQLKHVNMSPCSAIGLGLCILPLPCSLLHTAAQQQHRGQLCCMTFLRLPGSGHHTAVADVAGTVACPTTCLRGLLTWAALYAWRAVHSQPHGCVQYWALPRTCSSTCIAFPWCGLGLGCQGRWHWCCAAAARKLGWNSATAPGLCRCNSTACPSQFSLL